MPTVTFVSCLKSGDRFDDSQLDREFYISLLHSSVNYKYLGQLLTGGYNKIISLSPSPSPPATVSGVSLVLVSRLVGLTGYNV